jgi:hypothetical protein
MAILSKGFCDVRADKCRSEAVLMTPAGSGLIFQGYSEAESGAEFSAGTHRESGRFSGSPATSQRSVSVKKIVGLLGAAALLMAFPITAGFAQSSLSNDANKGSSGASSLAPGHQDRSTMTGPGASSAAPGQMMRNNEIPGSTGSVSGPSASGYAPGQRMQDPASSPSSNSR